MKYHFSRTDLSVLVLSAFALGGCIVLLSLRGPSVPLVLLTIGTSLVTFAKLRSILVNFSSMKSVGKD
jgi:hypothetical protein